MPLSLKEKKQIEIGLIIFLFFITIFMSLNLRSQYVQKKEICMAFKETCSYDLLKDKCFCDGEYKDMNFIVTYFYGGEAVYISTLGLNETINNFVPANETFEFSPEILY